MGNVVSRARLILGAVLLLNKVLDDVSKRLKISPGIPVPHPSLPFWTVPKSPISSVGKTLPIHADIIVIGSGITGTSFAYHALKRDGSLRIVMLEAREVCSGATGRNGGHINPPLFDDWEGNKERYGEQVASTLVKFRLAHVHEMQSIAAVEGITGESQIRVTEHLEVYLDEDAFEEARKRLDKWKKDMPEEAAPFAAYDGAEAMKKFQLADCAKGCIVGPGGAMHPYRFVTSLLAKLLSRYSDNFFIATNTPCTAIQSPARPSPFYTVVTPGGSITTTHVVHATNGWVSHLLSPMREKVIPARGTMSAQRPGMSLSSCTKDGLRSYVFHPGGLGYDYLTQLPSGERELMFGGGWASAFTSDTALRDIGLADDTGFSVAVASHLAGALPLYFGNERWGREKEPELESDNGAVTSEGEQVEWAQGRTKAQWGGILGISADGLPWVGRLPSKISGRSVPAGASLVDIKTLSEKERGRLASMRLAAPGEWISAGYTGEGMVHAWLCGKALACMVQDAEDEMGDWFPEMLRVTEERWKKANLEELISRRL